MKYYVIKMETAKYGYAIKGIAEDGKEYVEQCLNKKTPDDCLYLPDPVVKDTNRHFVALSLLAKQTDDFELTPKEYKAPRVLGKKEKDWTEYLTEEEKTTIAGIKAKCEERRAADVKSPEELEAEKLRRIIASCQAKLAKLAK